MVKKHSKKFKQVINEEFESEITETKPLEEEEVIIKLVILSKIVKQFRLQRSRIYYISPSIL